MKTVAIVTWLLVLGLAWAADSQEEAAAGIDDNAKAAYFVFEGYVFALNVADNGDVYYHMNAPASHSWMGVGFGDSMINTRMLISYVGDDGSTLTNSCRMSSSHSEPEEDKDCIIEGVFSDGYAPFANTLSPDGVMIAHAVCRNCSTWSTGALNLRDEAQPFIYALGPNKTLRSNDANAGLRLHTTYGSFNLNMTVATNYTGSLGRVPAPQDPALQVGHSFWAFANYYSSTPYGIGTLADWAPTAHAVFMILAFLLIFPIGAICLRLVRRAMFHAAAQMIGLVFVIIGFGLGIYASKLYNKSKQFSSAHQILGLLIFAGLFLQIGLGLSHHLIFMRSGVPTMMGKIHRFLGMTLIVLALVNGGLGFDFAENSNVAYAVVVAAMAVVYAALTVLVWRYNRKHVYRPEKEAMAQQYASTQPAEYEMHDAPFTDHVQTPQTPHFFAASKQYQGENYRSDPEGYRASLVRSNTVDSMRQESLYTDTPASDHENPFKGKWEAVPMR